MRTRHVSRWAAVAAVLAPATLLGGPAGSAGPSLSGLCEAAQIQTIVGTPGRLTGDKNAAICQAQTTKGGYAGLYVAFHHRHPQATARHEHAMECTAMAGVGPVQHPGGIGDQACSVSDIGLIKATTVIVRKGSRHIAVRYAAVGKEPTAIEKTALDVARRLASAN